MEKKDLSMEIRLLIAFALAGLILFVTPYFEKQTPPAQTAAKTEPPAAKTSSAIPVPAPAAGVKSPAAAEVPGQIEAGGETVFAIDTKLYYVEFSNRGAVVRRWLLKAYKDHDYNAAQAKPVDLVNSRALTSVPEPFSLAFKGQAPDTAAAVNTAFYQFQRPDNMTVNFEFSDGHIDVKKSFRFSDDSYLVAVTSQATQNGVPLPHALSWRGGFGDETASNALTNQHALYYDLDNSKLVVKQVKEAKNGPVSFAGQYSFAGLEDAYFAGVFLPEGHSLVELTEFSDQVPDATGKVDPRIGAAVGGEGSNTFSFFAGPKDYKLLGKINPKLEQLIDWTWVGISLGFIAKPIFIVLSWTADHITGNYGWAIILVTIGINTVLFPLRLTSMKSSKKMQAIQPLIKEMNDRYKGLSLKDPRQAEKNQEMMDLYKKHGINPLGGCLPMLIQLPFLVAFYKVLGVTIELRGASWLWVHDLSQPETLAIRLLPLILMATQFLQQKMTPQPGVDQSQQKMMMWLMPAMMCYIFYFLSSGLVLYYLTSNLVGIAQQVLLNRASPAPIPVAVTPAVKKKRN
ncbi:MAG TPA: membrane protein insertase YidC [Bryobacteraceae bacterium]|jgi:YidC/Oxa1 family membrane protein insertase